MSKFRILNISLISILLFINCQKEEGNVSNSETINTAMALTQRLLPNNYTSFDFKIDSSSTNKDYFELESQDGKIIITGNNGIALSSGLDWYLKTYCQSDISLNSHQISLPTPLPTVEKTRIDTPFDYRYFFNYCTYGYTMPWWDWERWEQMIDYMALKGVNMPLAMIGQEAVWVEVFKELGMTDEQIGSFFVGPAHLPWGWMGNIDGMGGPLPDSWIQKRKELQIKILNRMRSLGMKPVLQAFTGHVPEALKELYPEANIFQIEDWAGVDGTYFLDPTDSLFQTIGTAFIKKQTEIYGTDHLYDADCFIEVNPPSKDPKFLAQVSHNVYESMAKADPEAIWVLQGWFFFFKKDFWTKERGRAFLNGIPKNKVIVLDLYGEKNPTWDKTDAFYGQPWIWNVICNEDQKVNMSGDLTAMQDQFQLAFNSEIKNNLKGIGVIPEGLGYNSIIQDFIFEKTWDQNKVNIEEWISNYATRRYGIENKDAQNAWQILGKTVYNRTRTMWSPLITTPRLMIFEEGSKEDERHVRKDFKITEETPFAWDFDVTEFSKAADLILKASDVLKDKESYNFDVTNIYRELIAGLTHKMINDLSVAYQAKEKEKFEVASTALLKMLDDLDAITGTNENFLLGKWLDDARNWGNNKEEKDYFEWNARTIVTIWQPYPEGGLRDYAGKQWNGLFAGYYKPRWELFISHLRKSLLQNIDFNPKTYDKEVREMDYKWTKSNDKYPAEITGNAVEVAKRLQKEYESYFKE
ncbi:alpha-N-acetylglucosaminidase [Aureibaculum sp. A20]|uniref:Alpha-N-acetylglucosaminidase n=1 Tax=Aureibaculum flavum TaxID=2795986 RepID=A0ABS0WVR7_9FLAO|nr:alpha-N-acetylglucosaminidase [Aureibaculum flavum]MBJ2176060.1 alpha-N-acetylglucosaminidase [Aureibaculum flavum]